MDVITQTNRTILFTEINPECLNLLTLIGDVRGKTSLDGELSKDAVNKYAGEILAITKFDAFLSAPIPSHTYPDSSSIIVICSDNFLSSLKLI